MEDRTPDPRTDIGRHAEALRTAADELDRAVEWAADADEPAVGWLRRAAAVAWWRATRDGLPPDPTAALRQLADRCRAQTPTKSSRGRIWPRSAAAVSVPDQIAGALDALADTPIHPLSAIRDPLGALLDPLTDSVVSRLLDLAAPDCLKALAGDPALPQRVRAETPAGWSGRPAAAVAVARLLLREHAGDLAAWLPRWCSDFRLGFGTAGPPSGAATDPSGWWFLPPTAAAAPTDDDWANLPSPPATASYDCPMFHEARRATRGSATGARRAELKREFAEWVRTAPGAEYFDWFLRLASSDRHAADAARQWWRAIRGDRWATAYPDYDPDTDDLLWPEAVPFPREAVETVPSSEPVNAVVTVTTFAPDPAHARLTVSDGPPPLPAPLQRFRAAVAATDAAGWRDAWADGRWAQGRALALGTPGDAAAVAVGVLKAGADHPPNAERAAADAALTAVRVWAAGHDLTITPEQWTFGGGCERVALPASATVTYWYRKSEPPSVVYRIRRFGLTAADGERQAADVMASAGTPPAGFQELKGFANTEAARPLAELLARWATASVGGYLSDAAIELFAAFWGAPGAALRAADPPAADGFATQLAAVLAGFRLTVFHPQSMFEFADGWVQPVGDSPLVTGRVRTIHRPGLRDDANNLRLPALVEID